MRLKIQCAYVASVTGIPLYQLDSILYEKNGDKVDRKKHDRKYENILSSDSWIIDGFDLLVYILDLVSNTLCKYFLNPN